MRSIYGRLSMLVYPRCSDNRHGGGSFLLLQQVEQKEKIENRSRVRRENSLTNDMRIDNDSSGGKKVE